MPEYVGGGTPSSGNEEQVTLPYKSYVAILKCPTPTSDPEPLVIYNDLGTINFTRTSVGHYLATSVGDILLENKTFMFFTCNAEDVFYVTSIHVPDNQIEFRAWGNNSTFNDLDIGAGYGLAIEIRVYN